MVVERVSCFCTRVTEDRRCLVVKNLANMVLFMATMVLFILFMVLLATLKAVIPAVPK